MKKLLYILLLLPCLAWGQATKQWSITPTTGPNKGNGYPEWYAGNFPGYLGIPYGTNALLGRSADMDGLLYFQLSDSTLQVRIGGAWIPVGKKTAANYLYVSALYFGGSATFDDPMTVINSDSVGHHAPDYFAPGIRNLTINGVTHNLTADQIWTISGIAASNSDSLGHQPASYYQQQLNGTGFVKFTGTTASYDNSVYVPQSGAFTINDEKQSTYTPLALQDLARLGDLELVNTVLTGMLVTTVTTTATIPSGTYRLDNSTYTWAGGTVTIPAQDATKYRYSILYITTPGTIAISNGSLADTDPVIPTFPANSVEVAIIYIPPVGQTVTVTGGGKKTTGTVTNVSSTTADITVTSQTTTPKITLAKVNGFPITYYDPTSSLQTQLNARELLSNKATDFTTLNNTKYPTTQAVADYVATHNTPAGSNTQIQYNNSGAFGASDNFIWDNTHSRLSIGHANSTVVTNAKLSNVGEVDLVSDTDVSANNYKILPQNGGSHQSLRFATNTTEILAMGAHGGLRVSNYGFDPDTAQLEADGDSLSTSTIFLVQSREPVIGTFIPVFRVAGDGSMWMYKTFTGSSTDNILVHHPNGQIEEVAPSSIVSGSVPTSRTLTINGVAQDLSANRTWSVGTLTASNFVTAEVPSGSINSSNTAFTLSFTPTTGTAKGYRNGLRQIVGVDYTISGTAITYLYAPSTGDSLIFDYQK